MHKMNGIKPVIEKTEDGSDSLYQPVLHELYHSKFGAIAESEHVFIQTGLLQLMSEKRSIQILEIGFGTGLNAILTLMETGNVPVINYTAIELYPIDLHLVEALNYCDSGELKPFKELYLSLHQAEWGKTIQLTEHFNLLKINVDLLSFHPSEKTYDLIYFDAFSPNVQPELWSEEIFSKLYKSLKYNGILVTYCSKGIVKQELRSVGFEVKRLAGPHGKRHILRARKLL